MSTVIQVQNLSKRYRIGLKEKRHDTFAQQILATIKAPIQNFRQLRSMSKFGADEESIVWALKDINFEVQQGEVLGIIGHNGAGKSTLLKILSRITEPTSGEVRIKGRVSALLEVGTGFHPELTGRENIYMNGTILGMTRREIDIKLDEIMGFSGVEKYIDTPVKFYSSGMKVRLGFSVAAHLEPDIMVVDEVLAVGDLDFQRKAVGKMQSVSKDDSRTVLFVSHDMAAVRKLCTRAILLKQGQIIYYGAVKDTIQEYVRSRTFHQGRIIDTPRRYGTGEGKFTDIKLLNIQGEETESIMYMEPLSINIKLNIQIKCRVSLDVVIKTHEDNEILHVASTLKEEYYNLDPGDYPFQVDIENNLVPGHYIITLGLHHVLGGITIDYCEDVCPFEVLSAGLESESAYTLKTKVGYFIPHSKISFLN